MFGDFFLNFWLRRPTEDKEFENKTNNMRQLGLGRVLPPNPTRRSSLPSGPGGGFNRAVRRARAPRAPWTNRKAKADQPQMEKRQATSTNGKAKVDQEQMEKWQTNIDPKTQKTPKRHPRTENWPQEGRKWHHKRPKMIPRRAEEGAKTIPNRKSNQEAHQDDPKTVLGLGQGPISTTARTPWEPIWAPQNDPKRSRNRPSFLSSREKNISEKLKVFEPPPTPYALD